MNSVVLKSFIDYEWVDHVDCFCEYHVIYSPYLFKLMGIGGKFLSLMSMNRADHVKPVVPIIGLPGKISHNVRCASTLFIRNEPHYIIPGTCTIAEADKYIKDGLSRMVNHGVITHPGQDFYSHITDIGAFDSLINAYDGLGHNDGEFQKRVVISQLRTVQMSMSGLSGLKPRFVYWFEEA